MPILIQSAVQSTVWELEDILFSLDKHPSTYVGHVFQDTCQPLIHVNPHFQAMLLQVVTGTRHPLGKLQEEAKTSDPWILLLGIFFSTSPCSCTKKHDRNSSVVLVLGLTVLNCFSLMDTNYNSSFWISCSELKYVSHLSEMCKSLRPTFCLLTSARFQTHFPVIIFLLPSFPQLFFMYRLYVLESFYVHNKTEQEGENSHVFLSPTHA